MNNFAGVKVEKKNTHGCRCAAQGVMGYWSETPVWINRWQLAAENMKTVMKEKTC